MMKDETITTIVMFATVAAMGLFKFYFGGPAFLIGG